MLNREEYDRELKAARREQIASISSYLNEFIEKFDTIRDNDASAKFDEESLRKIKEIEIPRQGRDHREVADELVNDILGKSLCFQHPRCFSFVCSDVSPYSVEGSILSDLYNINEAGFDMAQGACLIEEKLCKWMCGRAGYPEETCGGVFTSGGSISNLTGMIAARRNKLTEEEYSIGVAYLSDQAHSSVKKGLRLMGLRSDQIVILPSDDDFRLPADLLEERVRKDIEDGKKPFLVIGTLATTNTGAIDPFDRIADICEKYDMWFHVDGAYGGSVLVSDIYKNLARGVERSDSLSWDTHKWSMQVYSCSSILVKNKQTLLDTYTEHPEYLADIIHADHNDPWDLSIEMSRPARAIKLWFTIQSIGTDKWADIIDYSFYNSKVAEKRLKELPEWEITSKPSCGCITFRYAPEDVPAEKYDELNAKVSAKINDSGFAYVVTTVLKGKRVLRFCLINGNTTEKDVIDTINYLNQLAVESKEEAADE